MEGQSDLAKIWLEYATEHGHLTKKAKKLVSKQHLESEKADVSQALEPASSGPPQDLKSVKVESETAKKPAKPELIPEKQESWVDLLLIPV